MAWLRDRVSLGSFPDLSGAINKLSEGVKNIEHNFDNARAGAGASNVVDSSQAWSPEFMAFVPHKLESSRKKYASSEKHDDSSKKHDESSNNTNETEGDDALNPKDHQDSQLETKFSVCQEAENVDTNTVIRDQIDEIVETNIVTSSESFAVSDDKVETETDSNEKPVVDGADESECLESVQHNRRTSEIEDESEKVTSQPEANVLPSSDDAHDVVCIDEYKKAKVVVNLQLDGADSNVELETLKEEMKKMETALLRAARQAQAKADEISKLMNENEQLKSIIVDQKKTKEAEIVSVREEGHQRVSNLERKVYALTKERDTLRREQNKRSDAAALLKEKDDIITQVMAEGEKLSKKQAVQESTIRKLRAQTREFEEGKKGLISKLQNEENKVENLKKEKEAKEKLMQEEIEKNKAEIAAQKERYMDALTAAKDAKALAEARANDEARNELESRLKEAQEREAMLVQTLNELRQTLIRKEHQAASREDMLRKDIDDLQKRYQASEHRCEELVMQVPESTRPLLRQIEAMQETTAKKAEAWATVERSLNIRLQDAEAKVAAAAEKDRSVNKRLSKTLSRINVLEAQISSSRSEITQLTKSLENERRIASERQQEYLALKEEADTHKDHANQLKEEITELKRKHKGELQELLVQRELLQQDMERKRSAHLELERTTSLQVPTVPGQNSFGQPKSPFENGLTCRLSSARSLSSMEESFFLQASIDSSHTFSETSPRETTRSSLYSKNMIPHAFQAALRQKEGELASYMSRLASMESIRDSLSEELVKMTEECEKLRTEVALLPSIKAELEALKVRHSAALELMGERDEQLEELSADIVDLKEVYREQVNMLVNKIQKGSLNNVD
ncbi:golgin candidate 5-like [Rutidosis leptorrhynchoides]|uniref:golgin candidate 5-like n=1 Tax=Rutidosis leptorrhynchoides TaxID=125765 RepID=UPI003A995352